MILLTGATGFLGGHIAAALAERGERVRLLVRDPRRLWTPPSPNFEIVTGELATPQWREWLRGIDSVVHAAAVVKTYAPKHDFRSINVAATRGLAEAARAAGVRRFIYVSTVLILRSSANEPDPARLLLDESQLTTQYQRTKRAGLFVIREQQRLGLHGVIVYPGILYGPGPNTEGNFTGKLVDDYIAGRAVLPRGSRAQEPLWSFAAAPSVAAGIVRLLDESRASGEYILAGPNLAPSQFLAEAARTAGKEGKLHYVPLAVTKAIAALDVARAVCTKRKPLATPGALSTLARDWAFNSSRAESDFGYAIPPLGESLRPMFEASPAGAVV